MPASDLQPSDIQPMAPAATDPSLAPAVPDATANTAAVPEDTSEPKAALPEAVLKIPAMHALIQGAPPATYGPLDSKMPEIKTLNKHADELKAAGFAAFKSASIPGNFVMFNGLIIKPEEVEQADKAGKLQSVAVPFEQLVESFKKTAKGEEDQTAPPEAPMAMSGPASGGVAVGEPPSAGVEKRLAVARANNLTPGSPTSGPAPGRGRVINQILKPVI
jgi:hypothetical protein